MKMIRVALIAALSAACFSGCAPFVAGGLFLPTNETIKEDIGEQWGKFEIGGIVEQPAPLLVRLGAGLTHKSHAESNALASAEIDVTYIIGRASLLYVVPGTGLRKSDGFYLGGGLSLYSWAGDYEAVILGLPVSINEEGTDMGINLVVGYRQRLEVEQVTLFGELVLESVSTSNENLSDELGKELGGLSVLFGVAF